MTTSKTYLLELLKETMNLRKLKVVNEAHVSANEEMQSGPGAWAPPKATLVTLNPVSPAMSPVAHSDSIFEGIA